MVARHTLRAHIDAWTSSEEPRSGTPDRGIFELALRKADCGCADLTGASFSADVPVAAGHSLTTLSAILGTADLHKAHLKEADLSGADLREADFSDAKAGLKYHLHRISEFLKDALKLELKARATILAPITNGIPFLGFRIYPRVIRVKRETLKRSFRRFKRREEQYDLGLIPFEKLNQSAGSIITHMSHANSLQLRRRLFYDSKCEG